MENKISKISIIVSIIILLVVVGLLGYNYLLKGKYVLNVYNDDNNEGHYCYNDDVIGQSCTKIAFTIKTESKDAKIKTFDDNHFFMLYDDNGLKLYDIKNKQTKKIDLENEYDNYTIVLNQDKQTIGIIYQIRNSNSIYYEGYYNIITNKKMYDNKYVSISPVLVNDKYLEAVENINGNCKVYLLDSDLEKEELVMPSKSGLMDISIKTYQGKNLYIGEESTQDGNYISIYSNKKEIIITDSKDKFDYSVEDGTLYINNNNVIKKFDFDGKIIN